MEQANQQLYQWDPSAAQEEVKILTQREIGSDISLDEAMQLAIERFVSDVKRYMENPEEEELEEYDTSMRNLVKGVALAQTNPTKAREFLYECWSESAASLFKVMTDKINPAARRLISEVLHFGPHADWNSSIAYSAEQDNLIQSCLVNLKSPSLTADMLREYAQKHPNCGMFKVLEGLLYIRTSSPTTGCKLLLDGYDMGIPEKYKYFIVNYINSELIYGVMIETKKGKTPSRERSLASLVLFAFVCKLFPSKENKWNMDMVLDGFVPEDKRFDLHYIYDALSNTSASASGGGGGGCCIWLVLGFAAVSAVGGGLYWLQTLI